jgi:hypothetical protein
MGGTPEGKAAAEKVVTFTIAAPTSDGAASDGLAQVFLQLYEILDGGNASWAQGTAVIVDDAKGGALVQPQKAMGDLTSR